MIYGERIEKTKKGRMIHIKSRIKGINVEYGKGKAILISAPIITKYGRTKNNSCICPPNIKIKNYKHKIIVAYVPPKSKNLTKEQHDQIIEIPTEFRKKNS